MLESVLKQVHSDSPAALERLLQLLAIPSVSTDPAYAPSVAQAAQWVASSLRDAGLLAQVKPTAGHPIVLAQSVNNHLPASAPHVLFYGHYDVQPPDPLEKWTTPPFEPTVRDGIITARGASDDKGPIVSFIEALRSWNQAVGKLPVKVTVLIEGEEECGSSNLAPFLEQHRNDLAADFVLIADTGMWDADTVAITYGLRGLAYFDVQLHGPSRDLHSGMYGGSIANPALELVRVLGKLVDDQGRITIPHFYDDVQTISNDELARWKSLGFDEADYLARIGVSKPWGEAGFSTTQRRWARPSCDVCGLFGGYGGPGAKTVLPSFAGAKVSFRLPPAMSYKKVGQQFSQWLTSHDVHGCTWKITDLHGADPVVTQTESSFMRATERAIQSATGRAPVLIREGATIPVVAEFKQILGLDAVMVGFGLADDRIHSPNENWDVDRYLSSRLTMASILHELAR